MQMNLTRGFGVIAMSNLSEEPLHPCAIVRYAMSVLRAQSIGEALPSQPSPPPDPTIVADASDYAGTFTSASTSLKIVNDDKHLSLIDGGKTYQMLLSDTDTFWTDDPRLQTFYLTFDRNRTKAVVDLSYGPDLYFGVRYNGPRKFPHTAGYDRFVGRYEGGAGLQRFYFVKGKLTMNGTPLKPHGSNTFTAGPTVIRFDTLAAWHMQRVWVDEVDNYRVELP